MLKFQIFLASLHCRVEILGRDVKNGFARLLSGGITDDDVQPAKTLYRLLDQRFAERLVLKIAGNRETHATSLLDQRDHLLSVGFLGRVAIDGDVSAIAAARPMPESPRVMSALRPARRPDPL